MRSLSNIEYREVQKEYYNEVLQSESIDVWFSPEYYTTFESSNQGQIWY